MDVTRPHKVPLDFFQDDISSAPGMGWGSLVSRWGVTLFVVPGLNHESQVACVASVSVGFQSKKSPKNGIFDVLALKPTETLATQANSQVA